MVDQQDPAGFLFFWLVLTQITASVLALGLSHLLGNSQFFFAKRIHTCQSSFSTLMLVQSAALFVVLLWPTLFLGAAFPQNDEIRYHLERLRKNAAAAEINHHSPVKNK